MKLHDAVICSVIESTIFSVPILEDEEGPRWKFGYSGRKVTDQNPDILLLGAYRHPSTGNSLVGGINLNYVTPEQRDKVARALPEIMKPNNLKGRYHAGRRLVPEVFNNFYRTYNSNFIRGVRKDVMYPKYGYVKTVKNWLKKKAGGIFKSKEKRQQDTQPKYQDDLQSMQDRLDQVVQQLVKNPPAEEPPDTPEMQAARSNFKDFQRRKTMQDIERQEDEPYITARQDLEQAYIEPGEQAPETLENPDYEIYQDEEESQREIAQESPREIAQELDRERRAREAELSDPNNEWDPNSDLEESIVYFSPITGRYMIEYSGVL